MAAYMRFLSILLAFSAFLYAQKEPPPRPREAKSDRTKSNKRESDGDKQKSPSKTQPLLNPVQAPTSHPNSTEPARGDQQQSTVNIGTVPPLSIKPIKDLADWGVWVFSLGLLVVGILQVWLLRRTWKATRENAQAARDNARAARANFKAAATNARASTQQVKLMQQEIAVMETSVQAALRSVDVANISADALVNSERAWLMFDLSNASMLQVTFRMKNWGRTPAWITDTGFWYINSTERIATIDYSEHAVKQLAHRPIIAPGDTTSPYFVQINGTGLIKESENDAIRRGLLFVHFFGIVKYLDIFGKSRTTCFCLTWQPNVDMLVYSGPQENNQHT